MRIRGPIQKGRGSGSGSGSAAEAQRKRSESAAEAQRKRSGIIGGGGVVTKEMLSSSIAEGLSQRSSSALITSWIIPQEMKTLTR